ncbi:MAG: hypothetical protein ACK532_16055 [Acidobacteriota bacterium]
MRSGLLRKHMVSDGGLGNGLLGQGRKLKGSGDTGLDPGQGLRIGGAIKFLSLPRSRLVIWWQMA